MMVAMTVGHLAWAFVPTDTLLSELLHFFGRLTIPLACFLVVIGFRLSRNITGYARRLFGFGLLAQLPFAVYIYPLMGDGGLLANPWLIFYYGNVLFTLGFGLLTLIILTHLHQTRNYFYGCVCFALLALLSTWSDWGMLVIFWVGAIYYAGAMGFLVMTLLLFGLSFAGQNHPIITQYIAPLNTKNLMDYGVFLSVPIMLWYEQNQHKSPTHYRLPRLLFYWYYVGHLVVISVLVFFIKHT